MLSETLYNTKPCILPRCISQSHQQQHDDEMDVTWRTETFSGTSQKDLGKGHYFIFIRQSWLTVILRGLHLIHHHLLLIYPHNITCEVKCVIHPLAKWWKLLSYVQAYFARYRLSLAVKLHIHFEVLAVAFHLMPAICCSGPQQTLLDGKLHLFQSIYEHFTILHISYIKIISIIISTSTIWSPEITIVTNPFFHSQLHASFSFGLLHRGVELPNLSSEVFGESKGNMEQDLMI